MMPGTSTVRLVLSTLNLGLVQFVWCSFFFLIIAGKWQVAIAIHGKKNILLG